MVEQVVTRFSDADPAVSRKRNPLRALRLHTRAFRGGPDPGCPVRPARWCVAVSGSQTGHPPLPHSDASGRVGGQVRRDRPGRAPSVPAARRPTPAPAGYARVGSSRAHLVVAQGV